MKATLIIVGGFFAFLAIISNALWLQIVLGICAVIIFVAAFTKRTPKDDVR
ncbi:hypothetical protein [Corynebacterium glucuronolyticum]|uniref:Uncharacterized protein n=1 Tax=Corynebacterium glucuronolyticum TaxID=39791 RepID=A0A7T4EGF9_9CORY|nr:hypothetical protein [Corynebacterium glucuronolyticum]EEI26298.1 hypothetical protein HMPREF0294_2191 [Corynebacterium glucuronolyticum ATCC 51867]QQB46924.1 hypothetical protein I6I10_03105 [Corynebacterium glucuronolyticum]QRO82248.1 hypothetical protein I6J20_10395 [Corynebacterium glucuronolyticum]WKD64799.1 hypothetical protein CGLUCO_12930 [Corynebacterium glucuronolyticum DSM 44120]SMB81777.1 hypothetical protein SAMN05660745_02486 [Corynebacterium glucuronolyticum]